EDRYKNPSTWPTVVHLCIVGFFNRRLNHYEVVKLHVCKLRIHSSYGDVDLSNCKWCTCIAFFTRITFIPFVALNTLHTLITYVTLSIVQRINIRPSSTANIPPLDVCSRLLKLYLTIINTVRAVCPICASMTCIPLVTSLPFTKRSSIRPSRN